MNMKKEKKYGKITVFVVFFKKSITFALALKKVLQVRFASSAGRAHPF